MINKLLTSSLCCLTLLATPVLADRVDSALDRRVPILRRCVHRIEQATFQTVRRMHHDTTRCLRTIHRLTAAGRLEEAAAVAERCKESLAETARTGAERIDAIATECATMLTEAGAPDEAFALLRRVAMAGKDFVIAVHHRAVLAIDNAIMDE